MANEYGLTDEPTSDEHAGYVAAMLAAAKRQMAYYDTAMRKYIADGGRVVSGDFEWKSAPMPVGLYEEKKWEPVGGEDAVKV